VYTNLSFHTAGFSFFSIAQLPNAIVEFAGLISQEFLLSTRQWVHQACQEDCGSCNARYSKKPSWHNMSVELSLLELATDPEIVR